MMMSCDVGQVGVGTITIRNHKALLEEKVSFWNLVRVPKPPIKKLPPGASSRKKYAQGIMEWLTRR